MISRTRLLAVALCTIISVNRAGLSADDAAPPRSIRIDQLVEKLGADDPNDREKAGAELEECSATMLPVIRAEMQRDDLTPEMKIRLRKILGRMEPRAKAKKRRVDYTNAMTPWLAQQELEVYHKHGHTNPKWDAFVEKAIELEGSQCVDPDQDNWPAHEARELKALQNASKAGCDDPTMLAVAASYSLRNRVPQPDFLKIVMKVFPICTGDNITPYDRIAIDRSCIIGRLLGMDEDPAVENDHPTKQIQEDICAQFKALAATPGVPKEVLIAASEWAFGAIENSHYFAEAADVFFPLLDAAMPGNQRVLTIKGTYYVRYAWEARGNGFGQGVGDNAWKLFGERLAIAKENLTKASEADPLDPDAPTEMLKVELGADEGRDVMEKWFKRAMDADPDNINACKQKLLYLTPKWHGTPEAMLEFGHQCLDTGNWHNGVAMMLIDVHDDLAEFTKGDEYYQNENVWTDINNTFSAFLNLYPNSNLQRSQLAYYACRCHRWTEADAQFKKLGDKVDLAPFKFNEARLEGFRSRAAEGAAGTKPNP